MKYLIQKAFCLSILVILATSFYDFGPLWFNVFILLPFTLFSAYSVITGDFTKQTYRHNSSSSTMHRRSYHASPIFRHANLMGTSSLSDRIRTFGR
jgi:hypothetical protein